MPYGARWMCSSSGTSGASWKSWVQEAAAERARVCVSAGFSKSKTVNNAAIEDAVGPITDQTAESFAATFETNVLGVVLK
jgi:NAD(P)-dependent dehydrogenase (short-subunit alcohol dehydrogenase family)